MQTVTVFWNSHVTHPLYQISAWPSLSHSSSPVTRSNRISKTRQPRAVVNRFSSSHKKEFKSKTDAGKHRSLLKQKYILEKEVWMNSEITSHRGSPDHGYFTL